MCPFHGLPTSWQRDILIIKILRNNRRRCRVAERNLKLCLIIVW